VNLTGGTEKNAAPLQSEKIATATFKIKLTELKKGEYGFLPPGSANSSIKIYTFGIE
jgi:hypothetical protein